MAPPARSARRLLAGLAGTLVAACSSSAGPGLVAPDTGRDAHVPGGPGDAFRPDPDVARPAPPDAGDAGSGHRPADVSGGDDAPDTARRELRDATFDAVDASPADVQAAEAGDGSGPDVVDAGRDAAFDAADAPPDDASPDAREEGGDDARAPGQDAADAAADAWDAAPDASDADASPAPLPVLPPVEEPPPVTGLQGEASCAGEGPLVSVVARGHDLLGLGPASGGGAVSPSGRLWKGASGDTITMSADRVLRRLRRDLGLAYSGSWRRPVLDDGLVFFNYRDFVLLVRVEPQPEVVTLLTADDMHRFVDEQEPLPALGAWDAAENRYVFALRSRPAIAAIDEAGHFEIVSDWSAVEAAGQQMDVWGVGWGDVDVDVDVVLPNGALVVRAWFLVDPDALNPRSSRPYLLLLDGAPSATVLATPEELAEQVDPECTCRAGRAAVLPDGSLLTTVEQVRDGAVNHYHFRLTPGERPVRWREPEALAHAFGYVPELHPVADGTYRIFTPRRFDLVTREPRLLFGGSIFSYAPPADLRLEVSWVDLLTAAESSNANLGSLAVAEGGTVFFKHFDRHSYNSFSEHWSGVWRTAAGDPPELLASVGGLDDAFNPEEHNSWPGLRYLLARDDDHLLFVGDRVGFSDLPDAVLEVDADGEVRVLLDAFAPGGGRVLPEGVNGVFNDLALDPNGDVLVLTGTGVLQLPADGGEVLVRLHADAVREITGADPYLWTFAVGPDGTIVIFDYWTYSLIRLPPDAAPELVPVVRETLGELFDFRRNGTSTPEDAFLDADGNFVARTFLMQPFNLDDADLIAISPEGEAFFPVPREALLEAAGNPPGVHVEGVERLPSLKVTAVAPTPDGGILLFERNSRRLLLACPARAGEP